jgi:predicted phosphate transport protein (TIGR00153 family)
MAVFKRTTKNLIIRIDEFIDNIDLGLLVFREAMKAYLEKDFDSFERHLKKVDTLENSADRLQREIENDMITHSVLPQHREEVVKLIDVLDEIIDSVKSSLNEIDIERPDIPVSLNKNLLSLAETSATTAEELVPAARAYFRAPYTVREKLLRVYYFESETDKMALSIKKTIFREIEDLDLARKNQLRYMVNHIENISDLAQKAADMLSGMAIKILI